MPIVDITASEDTYIQSANPTANRSASNPHQFGLISGKSTDDRRVLMRFDISSLPTDASKIVSCDLRIWDTSAVPFGIADCFIRRTTQSFDDLANWNTYDGSNNWAVAGGDYTATNEAALTPSSPNDFTDITALLKDAINNGDAFLEVILMQDASPTTGWTFASVEDAVADERPDIRVEYTSAQRVKRAGRSSIRV